MADPSPASALSRAEEEASRPKDFRRSPPAAAIVSLKRAIPRPVLRRMTRIGAYVRGFAIPSHPFAIWAITRIYSEPDHRAFNFPLITNSNFYLMPDRLRRYDLAFGLAFAMIMWLGQGIDFWFAVLTLAWIWLVAPALAFGMVFTPRAFKGLNVPVHRSHYKLIRSLPERLKEVWHLPRDELVGLASRSEGPEPPSTPAPNKKPPLPARIWAARKRIVHYIPRRIYMTLILLHRQLTVVHPAISNNPVYWMPDTSPHANFLRLCILDYFVPRKSMEIDSEQILRFALVYCTPVWISYFSMIAIFITFPPEADKAFWRVVMVFVWAAISSIFIVQVATRYGKREGLKPGRALDYLDHAIFRDARSNNAGAVLLLTNSVTKVGFGIISSFAVVAALATLQVLPAKSETQPPTACSKWEGNLTINVDNRIDNHSESQTDNSINIDKVELQTQPPPPPRPVKRKPTPKCPEDTKDQPNAPTPGKH